MAHLEWDTVRAILLPLFERAAEGNLRLAELPNRAQFEGAEHAAVEALLRDLEDGVEHFPGRLRGGEADWGAWEIAEERTVLLVDLDALRRATSIANLEKLRLGMLRERLDR